jgi:uncharacterized protein YyaL (SSP411 family)
MVLDGFSAAYRASGEQRFLDAGRRAADFLMRDLSPDGYFLTNGAFVVETGIKTYNVLCAWALHRFGADAQDERYQMAAVRIVEAALRQQRRNGWFASNCLTRPEAPLTHTISYTLQGILEVGVLAKRQDCIESVVRTVRPLLARLAEDGFLPGRFYEDWEPAAWSSCLTGSAQLAIVCYRLSVQTGDLGYRTAADRIVNHLKSLQVLESTDEGLTGALPGSFPIFGNYMTGGYPNWATKYFLDSLMLQAKLSS